MTEKRLSELDEKVLKLLDPDGSWYRMQLIFDVGEIQGISHITVQRKIRELTERGLIERWRGSNKNLKGVYYRRCEGIRIERLIDNTLQDISDTLDQLPGGEMSDIDKRLMEGSLSVTEGKWKDPAYLKSLIMFCLEKKILKFLDDNALPDAFKGKYRYEIKRVPENLAGVEKT